MIQRIFATNLNISSTAAIPPKSLGIVGGGGRSGSFIVGRLGRSGSSGSSGSLGRIGRLGSPIQRVGTSGRESRGNWGSTIGTKLK